MNDKKLLNLIRTIRLATLQIQDHIEPMTFDVEPKLDESTVQISKQLADMAAELHDNISKLYGTHNAK